MTTGCSGHGQDHGRQESPTSAAAASSKVCRGLLVNMTAISRAGVATTASCRTIVLAGETGEIARPCVGKPADEETDQENEDAAEDGGGHRGRGLPVAQQVPQPEAHVQPLALAEQDRLGVELIDRPADRQDAGGQGHAQHQRQVLQRLPVRSLRACFRSNSTTPVTGIRLLPRVSSTPGAMGSTASGMVTRSSGTR